MKSFILVASDRRPQRLTAKVTDQPIPVLRGLLTIMRGSPPLNLVRCLKANSTKEIFDLRRVDLLLKLSDARLLAINNGSPHLCGFEKSIERGLQLILHPHVPLDLGLGEGEAAFEGAGVLI